MTVAGAVVAAVAGADEARAEAERILSDPKYSPAVDRGPGWLERVLDRLAGWIPDPISAALGSWLTWLIAGLVVLTFVVVALVRSRRRGRPWGRLGGRGAESAPGRDAGLLERRAEEAEAAGDYSLAIRLRFEAGAVRLAERGVIDHDETLTAGGLRRAVRLHAADHAAAEFDRVAYGGRAAGPEDAAMARDDWRAIAAAGSEVS